MLYKLLKTAKIVWRSLQIAVALVWSRAEMYCTQTGVISGKNGVIKTGSATFGSATDFNVKNWKLTFSGGAIPVPDSSVTDGGMPKVPAKYVDGKGSFDALFRFGDTPLSVNTAYDAHLVLDDVSADEVYYSGSIIITELSLEVPIDDNGSVVMQSYSFEVNGVLTKTDASQV